MGCGASTPADAAKAPAPSSAAGAAKKDAGPPTAADPDNQEIVDVMHTLPAVEKPKDPELAKMQQELDDEMNKLLNMEEIVGDKAEAREEARKLFDKYDADGSKKLEVKELRSVLQKLGLDVSEEQFEAYALMLLKDFDKNSDLAIDFNEFYKFYYKCMRTEEVRSKYAAKLDTRAGADEKTIKEAKKIFAKYDVDKSGTIDQKELDKVLRDSLKDLKLSDEQWKHYTKDIMARGDKNKSGVFEFDEFYNMYKKCLASPEIKKKYQQKVVVRYEDGKWKAG